MEIETLDNSSTTNEMDIGSVSCKSDTTLLEKALHQLRLNSYSDTQRQLELPIEDFDSNSGMQIKRITYKNGDTYIGQMADGKKCGFGEYTFVDGSIYKGGWAHGKYHNEGTLAGPDGLVVYQGSWKHNIREGYGILNYPCGSSYSGQFVNNEFHGYGEKKWVSNVWVYETGYKFYKKEGSTYKGTWIRGKRCGTGTYKYIDGSSYHGGWKNNQYHGFGMKLSSGGDVVHEGEWREGKRFQRSYRASRSH